MSSSSCPSLEKKSEMISMAALGYLFFRRGARSLWRSIAGNGNFCGGGEADRMRRILAFAVGIGFLVAAEAAVASPEAPTPTAAPAPPPAASATAVGPAPLGFIGGEQERVDPSKDF